MKVSVIIPSSLTPRKHSATDLESKLIRAVATALNQDYEDVELVIVSDGCELTNELILGNDYLMEIGIEKFKHIYLPKQPAFSGNVRNAGIEVATGDIICYLDADDYLGTDHVSTIVKHFTGQWVWFNDMTLIQDKFVERECSLKLGLCGTSNIAHLRSMKARWHEQNTYGRDDWNFIQELQKEAPHGVKIETPSYIVCHIPFKRVRCMKLLELFAGSRSIGKVAEGLGIKVFSIDIEQFDGIDLVKDIEFVTPIDIPIRPDIIWASPPCTTYSIAGISHHRDTKINGVIKQITNKTDLADKSDRLIKRMLELIDFYDCMYFIENPRGLLRKMPMMRGLPRVTVWYCKYGDDRAKPTDIWSNNIQSIFNPKGWNPRPECHNGNSNCHHQIAPRGSKTGTQGRLNDYKRSKIPGELAKEILMSCYED